MNSRMAGATQRNPILGGGRETDRDRENVCGPETVYGNLFLPDMVAHTLNPHTKEAEAEAEEGQSGLQTSSRTASCHQQK